MELDDFKNNKDSGEGNHSADQFIESVKEAMKTQKVKSIYYAGMLVLLSVIYLSLSRKSISGAGYALVAAGMVAGAIYIYLRYKSLPDLMFTLPMKEFLNRAEARLNYMNLSDWLIVIPLILIFGTGGGIIFITSLSKYTDNLQLLYIIWVLFFISLCVFGISAGRKNWLKEHGALLDELKEFKKNLE